MRFLLALQIGLLLGGTLLVSAPVRAQGDPWSVRRSAFDPRVVARHKAMLRRSPSDAKALAKLVGLYRKHRTLDKLVGEFRAEARAQPKSYALALILARLQLKAGEAEAALGELSRAAELGPTRATPHALRGAVLERRGELSQARAAYEEALSRARGDKQKRRYLDALAGIALSQRDLAAAADFYRKQLAIGPKSPRLLLKLAQVLAEGTPDAGAVTELEQGLKGVGDSQSRAQILKEIGNIYGKLGQTTQAMAAYDRATALTARGHWLRREITEKVIELYRKQDDLRGLIALLEKKWSRRGGFENEVLGRLYDETGDEERALKAYRAALRAAPHAVQTRLRVIALLERAGRTDEVHEEYRRLARVAPGEPKFQIELGRRLYRAGQEKEALAVLNRCAARFPGDASVQSVLADLYTRLGDRKRALKASRAMVRIEPDDPVHLINLGELYYDLGQKGRAVATWRKLLRAVPRRHEALARLAEVFGRHGMVDKAVSLYQKAIKLSPKTLGHRRNLALLLETNRRRTQALSAWREVLSLAEQENQRQAVREARRRIIAGLERTYRLRRSMRSWQRQLGATQPDLEAGFLLAEAHVKRGDLASAARTYRAILQHRPDDLEALESLAAVYQQQRKLAEAVATLKKLASLRPTSARHYYQQISSLLLQLRRDDEAELYARKAVAEGSRDAEAYRRLGDHYRKKGDYQRARDAYGQALKLNPRHDRSYLELAQLQTLAGQHAEADKLYRQVIAKSANPEVVRAAFRRAVNIASYLGTTEKLERTLLPLAVTRRNGEIYRESLVVLYRRQIPLLIDQLRQGDPATRTRAAETLQRIGRRGLSPLLEELSRAGTGVTEVIRMLGYLGNPNAALPLLRLAQKTEENLLTIYGSRRGMLLRGYPYMRMGRAGGAEDRSLQRKLAAVVAVGRIGHARAVPGLVELSGNRAGVIRDAAAWALARVASAPEEGRKALGKVLFEDLGDERDTVQMMACAGLGVLGEAEMRPVLEEVMTDRARSRSVRAACAWGLGALGDARAVPALVRVLGAGDGETQRCAAWSLGRLGDASVAPELLRSLWNRRARVRQAVVWAMVRLSETRREEPPRPRVPDVVLRQEALDGDALLRALTREVDDLRGELLGRRLAGVLEAHGEAVVSGLDRALQRHRDTILRALADLDRLPETLSLGPLTEGYELLSDDQQQRLRGAVQRVGGPLVSRVVPLLSHRDPLIRTRAVSVVAKLLAAGGSVNSGAADLRLGPLLRARMTDPVWRVRLAAVRTAGGGVARGQIPVSDTLDLVRRGLADDNWQVREQTVALASGARLRAEPAVGPLLARAVADKNAYVRQAAVAALGRFSDGTTSAALGRALADPIPQVRLAACRAVATRKDRALRPAVTPLLKDRQPQVRRAAGQALEALR